jgi:hypothetical protein
VIRFAGTGREKTQPAVSQIKKSKTKGGRETSGGQTRRLVKRFFGACLVCVYCGASSGGGLICLSLVFVFV